MGKKQEAKSGLGRAIQNAGSQPRTRRQRQERHCMETGVDRGSNLSSIIERNDLDEFVANAMLEQREFIAERGTVTIVSDGSSPTPAPVVHAEMYDYARVAIPRRPSWDASTTRDELETAEKTAFLDWRRELALISQSSQQAVTPYEKNLEVWRQLWRVVERSDLIVQIVDARNPLLFYCKDLVSVAADLGAQKRHLVVVNKADFLSDYMRACWDEYFAANGIHAVFFSAKEAVALQELQRAQLAAELDDDDSDASGSESELDDDDDLTADSESDTEPIEGEGGDPAQTELDDDHVPDSRAVLNTRQLMDRFLKAFWEKDGDVVDADRSITVGLVGYPNVGKSSIINALMGEKKVGVAAMPGKTRHFQTLILNDSITLCDCPGLVFPTFMNSQADLVVNGIIPIDRLRDYLPPVELVARRVHKRQFANLYGLRFADFDTRSNGSDLLSEFARVRGLVTGRGLPDLAMASRSVLKDFTSGRLLYCHPSPCCDPAVFLQSLEIPDSSARRPQQGPLKEIPAPDTMLLSTLSTTPAPGQGMAFTGSAKGVKKALKMARARQKAQMRAAATESDAPKRKHPKGAKLRNVIAVSNY